MSDTKDVERTGRECVMKSEAGVERPSIGVALMMEPAFAQAALPLFAEGEVEVVEFSFDQLWEGADVPEWLPEILREYSDASRLFGHGVSYSMFTADGEERGKAWCARLAAECRSRRYQHITEHFGFMFAGCFHRGAPLPVPFTRAVLDLGKDRIQRLAEAAGVPVGLENLAFAFGIEDVQAQGEFLDKLLEPVDGFILLDLHNVYCQSENFGIAPDTLLASYPLERVGELHISGGSWSEVDGSAVRRDTHDGPVPEELFGILRHALDVCPNVRTVIFEHLGTALLDQTSHQQYAGDFRRIVRTVDEQRAR